MLVYGGGALMALLLEGEMVLNQGEGRFDAMIADLYAGREERYDLTRLMTVLDKHSGGASTRILEALNVGMMPADLKNRLASQGIDLGVFAPEDLYVRFSESNCSVENPECLPVYFQVNG